MGFTYAEPGEAVLVRSTVSASRAQAFRLWRKRPGLEPEMLGFFNGGSSVSYPAFPQRCQYFVSGYNRRGSDWHESRQAKSEQGNVATFRHDDGGGGDSDFNDLIVFVEKHKPAATSQMFADVKLEE